MANNHINKLEIENFKSIKKLELKDFRKINLFIGKPNVGKSNILEALSLFTFPLAAHAKTNAGLKDLIRFEEPQQLFFDSNIKEECNISFKINSQSLSVFGCKITYYGSTLDLNYFVKMLAADGSNFKTNNENFKLDNNYNYLSNSNYIDLATFTLIKKYIFHRWSNNIYNDVIYSSLLPPFGYNILNTLEVNPKLKKEFSNWFKPYGLRIVFDKTSNSLKILKDKGDEIILIPYSLIADTLQRIIFYKAAIASNDNSVLIFEEPEAHAFPPYISEFTQEVIRSETNQFFIATHSPLIVNDFLENSIEDLSIFMVNLKDGETVIKPLSREEMSEVYSKAVDIFFNFGDYAA